MAHLTKLDPYGALIEPATLKLQRLLPGPIARCWDWLTDSDLRQQWLASGEMDLTPGAPFEFTWRNDRLTQPTGKRPEGFKALPDFGWVASDMVAWTGDPRWYSNAPGPRYGPHQEVDDVIPF
mgnify:CR=1 FL=1